MLELLPALFWGFLNVSGGIWLCQAAFNLRRDEQTLTGLACGFVVQIWLARWLGIFLPPLVAFWGAAVLLFISGLVLIFYRQGRSFWRFFPLALSDWLLLFLGIYVFSGIERGLPLFDDSANLLNTSLLAAGTIPLQFQGSIFLPLFSAELQDLLHLFPWNALDMARAFSITLAVLLAGIWVRRLTHNRWAGWLACLFAAFGMGGRWLLLFLPPGWLQALSGHLALSAGSDRAIANLPGLLTSATWGLSTVPPALDFPTAFTASLYLPGVMAHDAYALFEPLILLCLLLTASRWSYKPAAWGLSFILLSALSLLNALLSLYLLLAFLLITVLKYFSGQRPALKSAFGDWGLALLISSILLILQTDFSRVSAAIIEGAPALISTQLGRLSLLDPAQLLLALAEIGLALLILPLLFFWGRKAYQSQHWFEAALIMAAFLSLIGLFINFSVADAPSAHTYIFISLAWLYAVPLGWRWASHRSQVIKGTAIMLAVTAMLGGILLFGIELTASINQRLPEGLTSLDAQLFEDHWNRLEPAARIFDAQPQRSAMLLGRPTLDTGKTISPDLHNIRRAGYNYIYIDQTSWDDMDASYRLSLQNSCVQVLAEYKAKHGDDFRRLLDINTCP